MGVLNWGGDYNSEGRGALWQRVPFDIHALLEQMQQEDMQPMAGIWPFLPYPSGHKGHFQELDMSANADRKREGFFFFFFLMSEYNISQKY